MDTKRQKLGMGYEEGRDFYEGVYARRSKGLAPNTRLAAEHYEIEDNLYNRETAQYGRHQDFPNLNNPNYHRLLRTGRSYNVLSSDMYDYAKEQL